MSDSAGKPVILNENELKVCEYVAPILSIFVVAYANHFINAIHISTTMAKFWFYKIVTSALLFYFKQFN